MYQRSIITFIDILGFREIVSKRTVSEVDRILDLFNEFGTPCRLDPDEESDPSEPVVLSFSDSIIRVRNLESEENLAFPMGHLFHEVNSLVHLQTDLVNYGVLVRGGVSVGPVSVSANRVFGPGFVDAYELESKFAIYPRIIVSPELIRSVDTDVLVVSEHHSSIEEKQYLRTQLVQGDDGIHYVDYLRASQRELDDPDDYPDFLLKHKQTIVEEGGKHKAFSGVAAKYLWLARYHNQVIAEISDEYFEHYGLKRNNFEIVDLELSTLSTL